MILLPKNKNILILITLGLTAFLAIFPIGNFDIFWHLANGREMLETGKIVESEILSYTAAGVEFVNHEWLSQQIFYGVYKYFGLDGLVLLKSLVCAAVVFFVYSLCRIGGLGVSMSLVVAVLVIFSAINRFTVRPHIFSLLFLSIFTFLLFGVRHYRLNRNWLWLIPALILIWDVMHGAIYGIALVFLFVAGEICTSCLSSNFSMARLEKGKKQYLTTMCFVSAAVVLVAAINPYGMIGYKFFISLLAGNQMAAQVGEFTKTPFWDVYTLFWVGFAFSIVVCLWCIRNKELTVPFILIPFSILAFLYSRVTAPFAVIAFPLVAISLLEATKNIRNTRLMRYSHALPLVLLVFIFGFIFQYKIFSNSHLNSFGLGLHDRYFPAGSLRFVQDNRIDGRLYNPGRFGGYLAFNQPDKKIFLYNHHTVFGDLYSSLTNPFSVLKWDVNYAYVGDYWQSKHLFPLSEWAPVYWERANMLMLRRVESNREIIAEHEIQYFTPFRGVEKLRELAGDRNIYPKLMKELTTYLRYRGDANIAREYSNMMRLDNPGLPIATKLRLVGDAMLSNSLELKPLWESLSAGSNQKE